MACQRLFGGVGSLRDSSLVHVLGRHHDQLDERQHQPKDTRVRSKAVEPSLERQVEVASDRNCSKVIQRHDQFGRAVQFLHGHPQIESESVFLDGQADGRDFAGSPIPPHIFAAANRCGIDVIEIAG